MADRPELDRIAEAIADGRPVDWASAEAAAATDDERSALSRLKALDQLASRRRGVSGTPPSPTTAPITVTTSEAPESSWHWGDLAILEKVGEGAFGEVYRAHDPKLARDVALKLLREPIAAGTSRTIAIEEGRLLARVRHPNVVTVYGADRIEGRVGVWMELLHGQTLEEVLRVEGVFPAKEAAQAGATIARALAAVHDAGLVHQDIKAQNVMREHDGRLVLMDFGTGRERAAAEQAAIGNLTGTPLYVAPEVLRGEPATPRSDIYSLGVLLYHLLTGAYPVAAPTISSLVAAHDASGRTSLRDARPDLPLPLVQVVERASAADANTRFATARELAWALEPTLAADATVPTPPRRIRQTIAALSVIVGVLAIIGLWRPAWLRPGTVASATPPASSAPTPSSASSVSAPLAVPESAPSSPARSTRATTWVLIGHFDNRTGDSALDGTVEELLERELVQAPHVSVAGQARIGDALAQMKVPANTVLDPPVARDICLRDGGIQVLITGTVEKTPAGFVIKTELSEPADGAAIGTSRESAETAGKIPAAIRRAALEMRTLLGEAPDSVAAGRRHLEHVTTPMMAALQAYTEGLTAFVAGRPDQPDLPQREQYFRQATKIDPDFAAAYLQLAINLNAQHHPESEYAPALERAMQLEQTSPVTELERHLIGGIAHYWRMRKATDESWRAEARMAAADLEAALSIDPGNDLAMSSLHSVDATLGVPFDKSEIDARFADMRPLNFTANISAADVQMKKGDLTKAVKYYEAARRIDPDNPNRFFRLFPSYQAWANNDMPATWRALEKARSDAGELLPDARARVAADVVGMFLTLGRVTRAAEVADWIPPDQAKFRVAAKADVLLQQLQDARAQLSALLLPHLGSPLAWPLKDYWVSAGRPDDARHIMLRYSPDQPDLLLDLHIAGVEKRYDDAVGIGQQYLASLHGDRPPPRALLWIAQAYRAQNDPDHAITALELDASVSAIVANALWPGYEWLELRAVLADLYRLKGRKDDARKIERDILRRLSAADPTFPLLVELKRRLGG